MVETRRYEERSVSEIRMMSDGSRGEDERCRIKWCEEKVGDNGVREKTKRR